MANTLFLVLQGPLQSWGERAQWDVRDTAPEPTKSGVIGLLGCALGLSDDAPLRELSSSLRMGTRCDRPGTLLRDYHTVMGAVTAKGKVLTERERTILTDRHYLADAAFLVCLQGPDALIAECADAVQRPHWPIYLGRKCCVPNRPVYEGTGDYGTLREALASWPRIAPRAGGRRDLLAVIESPQGHGARRHDELISRSYRVFRPRTVEQLSVDPPEMREETQCIWQN